MSHYYHPQTKLWEGNVFTPVCASVHSVGVCASQHAMGQEGCLPRGLSAWEGVCLVGRGGVR